MAHPQPVREEVADAVIFLLSISQMLGFDAGMAVRDKLALNEQRTHRRLANGTQIKTGM